MHKIPAHPLPTDLWLRTDYLPWYPVPTQQQVDARQPLPLLLAGSSSWLLLPPPWFPCHWVTGTLQPLCRSRAQGSRTQVQVQVQVPKVNVDRAAHCSFYVCSAVTSRGLGYSRPLPDNVSLDKFVPSLSRQYIARSHPCSAVRGSQSSTTTAPHTFGAYTSGLLLPLLYFYLSAPTSLPS